jgi:5-methylcytosine-specific restriction endonuclease McrA
MIFTKMLPASNTPDVNRKKGQPGPLHPRFLADRSKVKNRPSYEGRIFKEQVLKRDGYKCVLCGDKDNLIADHIKPYLSYTEERFSVDNGN